MSSFKTITYAVLFDKFTIQDPTSKTTQITVLKFFHRHDAPSLKRAVIHEVDKPPQIFKDLVIGGIYGLNLGNSLQVLEVQSIYSIPGLPCLGSDSPLFHQVLASLNVYHTLRANPPPIDPKGGQPENPTLNLALKQVQLLCERFLSEFQSRLPPSFLLVAS